MRWDPTVTLCLLVTSGFVGAAWLAGARRRRDG
jgi:hypothetical protein